MYITKSTINKVYKSKAVSVETMEIKGYELVKELFVDSSGLGQEDEPALTKSQFQKEVNALLDAHYKLYATITRQGQFQVYIGLFKKGKKKVPCKVIANNTNNA